MCEKDTPVPVGQADKVSTERSVRRGFPGETPKPSNPPVEAEEDDDDDRHITGGD